jgi:general nucleoside transport system permease protein
VRAMNRALRYREPRPAASLRGAPALGMTAVALGFLSLYLVLPPVSLRTWVPSLIMAVGAVVLGHRAVRRGRRRLGWAAITLAAAASAAAIATVQSDAGRLDDVVVWSALIAAMLRYATPLIFAALGGVLSERAGVINIGLEGMMLMGAFFGAWGADASGSWALGLAAAVAAGGGLALLYAVFAISLGANQLVAGTAVNFLGLGITGYLFVRVYGTKGTPADLPALPTVDFPLDGVPLIADAIGQLGVLVWVALALVGLVWLAVFRTPAGLNLRAVGEHPTAADTVGISVGRMRYAAVTASGMLAALGGAFLAIGFVNSFSQNMTAGRGFIALAAVIFGRWHPVGALGAALLFGFAQALAGRLGGLSPSIATLFQALPYLITIIVVAGLVGRSKPPAALGTPYQRGN